MIQLSKENTYSWGFGGLTHLDSEREALITDQNLKDGENLSHGDCLGVAGAGNWANKGVLEAMAEGCLAGTLRSWSWLQHMEGGWRSGVEAVACGWWLKMMVAAGTIYRAGWSAGRVKVEGVNLLLRLDGCTKAVVEEGGCTEVAATVLGCEGWRRRLAAVKESVVELLSWWRVKA